MSILKRVLACLLVIPCMLAIVACNDEPDTNEISLLTYSSKVQQVANSFLTKYVDYETFADMKTVVEVYEETNSVEEVSYKKNIEDMFLTTEEFDCKSITQYRQTVEIDAGVNNAGFNDIHLVVTSEGVLERSGSRVDITNALESYKERKEYKKVIVYGFTEDEYNQYVLDSYKEYDNNVLEDETETKKVYTFNDREDYIAEIETILDTVRNDNIVDSFMVNSVLSSTMLTSSQKCEAKGNEFWKSAEIVGTDVERVGSKDYAAVVKGTSTIKFVNNNAATYVVDVSANCAYPYIEKLNVSIDYGSVNVVLPVETYEDTAILADCDIASFEFDY